MTLPPDMAAFELPSEADYEASGVERPARKVVRIGPPGESDDLLSYFSNGKIGKQKSQSETDETFTVEVNESGISWVKPSSYCALQPHETRSKIGLKTPKRP